MISLRDHLAHHQVEASAPCRIDSGGTWDIKALALPLQGILPVTVNIAVNLRTTVVLSPYEDGWVKISSQGVSRGEAFPVGQLPFNSPLGLFFGALSYFGFHGLEVGIRSGSPVRSALGGSSTALVALIRALAKVSVSCGGKNLTAREILHLAYHLEDGMGGGNCGLQDHAAAVYGGVHEWRWQYGYTSIPFEKNPLLDRKGQNELSERLLVAYSGKSHVSARINRNWIRDFLSGRTRAGWTKVNETVHHFARAVRAQDWKKAANLLRAEMAVRREITPEALIPITAQLVDQAEHSGCGARFAGAGAGGSLWALGEPEDIGLLREMWEESLAAVRDAKVLDCSVDPVGVR